MKRLKLGWPLLLGLVMISLTGCKDGPLDLSIRYDSLDNLKPRAPVYYQSTRVGQVEKISSTRNGDYLVEIAIDPDQRSVATDHSRFYLTYDPTDAEQTALVIEQDPPGGTVLAAGSIVAGEKRLGLINRLASSLQQAESEAAKQLNQALASLQGSLSAGSQRLNAQLESSLTEIENYFRDLDQSLNSPRNKEELRQLQQSLDAFVAEFNRAGQELQNKLREEVLPQLRQQLEALKKRLEREHKTEEAQQVDGELERILSV
ncbi:MlaD family protein [Pelobacter seleniigenes]|uniref:MlaD family protein n=1 Tax=Pelobacter seleniigenes TaxID=407188 RepID=UPI0004A6CA59|nr:MlaD family protein [Pelobacter seleniigenes]